MGQYDITFPETAYRPVSLPEAANLSQRLTAVNSPMLFGCRTGICGTCLVEVVQGSESLDAPTDDEREVLDVYAPDNPKARLACQIRLTSNLALKKLSSV